MTRMLSETEAGKLRVKSSDDRWSNAAVRRSDFIFAEAEEKTRKTENDGEETTPAAEATLTGGSSGSGGPSSNPVPRTLLRPIRPGEQVTPLVGSIARMALEERARQL